MGDFFYYKIDRRFGKNAWARLYCVIIMADELFAAMPIVATRKPLVVHHGDRIVILKDLRIWKDLFSDMAMHINLI